MDNNRFSAAIHRSACVWLLFLFSTPDSKAAESLITAGGIADLEGTCAGLIDTAVLIEGCTTASTRGLE